MMTPGCGPGEAAQVSCGRLGKWVDPVMDEGTWTKRTFSGKRCVCSLSIDGARARGSAGCRTPRADDCAVGARRTSARERGPGSVAGVMGRRDRQQLLELQKLKWTRLA